MSQASDRERWRRLSEVLDGALELPAPSRASYLDRACGGDRELRREVEELLEASSSASFLAAPALQRAAPLVAEMAEEIDRPRDPVSGRLVGAYRLLSTLGEGGMGTVYLAERADGHFEHRVAIKLLKHGLQGEEARRRFLRERQILARLEHPAIARLLDGGVSEEGIPFFVMEHVDGRPITSYCDGQGLGIEQRLAVFLQVCDAVQYAHRNLVVHRDLKPSNILVDAAGSVKLLDFGIATLLAQEESGLTAETTRTRVRAMTPECAAPEQVRGDPVTTATDVYALGVLLHELLTDQRPYRLERGSASEWERAILEQEPGRPSARAAVLPGLGPRELRRRLRGDLDSIVLKALQKQPERRYPSAEVLASDVRRHLAGLPISARGDALGYRIRKFLRRHRLAVAAAGLVVLALAAGLVGTAWQARRAWREAQRTAEVQRFLLGLFQASDPRQARGRVVTARELLDRGAQRAAEIGHDPELQVRISSLIGSLYIQLGEYRSAEPLVRRAIELDAHLPGLRDPRARLADLGSLGLLYYERGAFAEALGTQSEATALAKRAWGPRSVEVARCEGFEAWVRRRIGQFREAEALRRRSLATFERVLGPDHEETRGSRRDLATLLADMGMLAEAERLQRRVLEGDRRQLGADDLKTLNSGYQLARVLVELGRLEEAQQFLAAIIPVQSKVLGERHDHVAMSQRMRARALEGLGRYAEARKLIEEVLAIQRERLGPEDAQVAVSLRRRASIEAHLGDPAAAERDARHALQMLGARFGKEHYDTAAAEHELAEILLRRGTLAEAETLLREAERIRRLVLGPHHYQLGLTLDLLSLTLLRQDRAAQAVPLAEEALQIARESLGEDSAAAVLAKTHLAQALLAEGQTQRARTLLGTVGVAAARVWPAGHPDRLEVEAASRALTR